MPTYDYACESCGHRFEAFQAINDPLLNKCPMCGQSVRRLIGTGAGLIFKGSGFYITDYKRAEKAKNTSENKEKVSSPETNSKPAGSGKDSKTEKAEKKPGESKTKS